MKNEVKALIGQLTAERTRIDVAILALKAIGGDDMAQPVTAKAAVKSEPQIARRRPRSGHRGKAIAADVKARVVASMETAPVGHLGDTARELSRSLGISAKTIQTAWQRWAKSQSNNGNVDDAQPLSSVSAIGVQ